MAIHFDIENDIYDIFHKNSSSEGQHWKMHMGWMTYNILGYRMHSPQYTQKDIDKFLKKSIKNDFNDPPVSTDGEELLVH